MQNKKIFLQIGANKNNWVNWWESLYNTVAKKAELRNSNPELAQELEDQEQTLQKKFKDKKPLVFGSFVSKGSVNPSEESESEEENAKEQSQFIQQINQPFDPNRLFLECGMKGFSQSSSNSQSGKLERLRKQESSSPLPVSSTRMPISFIAATSDEQISTKQKPKSNSTSETSEPEQNNKKKRRHEDEEQEQFTKKQKKEKKSKK